MLPLYEAAARELGRVAGICRSAAESASDSSERTQLVSTAVWSEYWRSLYGQFGEAASDETLSILEDGVAEIVTLDPHSPLPIAMVDEIAFRLHGRGALSYLVESVELRRGVYGPESLEYAEGLARLGVQYRTYEASRYEIDDLGLDDSRAEELWLEALEVLESLPETVRMQTETYAEVLWSLENLYEAQRRAEAAQLVGEKKATFLERARSLPVSPEWLENY
jgi:hypothetical protein